MHVQWRGLLLGMSLLSACTSIPTGPSVLALPAVGKPMDVFQAEEDGCRAYAQQQAAAGATPRQSRYDIAYIQCMYAKGNVIPGVVAPAPPAPSPSALPPPTHTHRGGCWGLRPSESFDTKNAAMSKLSHPITRSDNPASRYQRLRVFLWKR